MYMCVAHQQESLCDTSHLWERQYQEDVESNDWEGTVHLQNDVIVDIDVVVYNFKDEWAVM